MFFIQRLRLNRPQLVTYRLDRHADDKLPQEVQALRRRVCELEQSVGQRYRELTSAEVEIERESR